MKAANVKEVTYKLDVDKVYGPNEIRSICLKN